MRIVSAARISLLALTALTLFSCDEKEEFITEKNTDYIILTPGKYITYRLDSTVFTFFNSTIEVHKYQVKHVVDALVTDNLGRPSYRVYRYIRDSVDATSWTPAQPWINSGTYFVTPLADQVELIEDNLRFIKLHMPMTNNFTWSGNRYLPPDPYGGTYTFSNDDAMEDWQFYYDSFGETFSYKGKTYQDVVTVEQEDDVLNYPVTAPNAFGYKSRAVEKYAKNIGLVYREYSLFEYQPNPAGGPNGTYYGFGINMWMIDHN
jgi:hypothetical protein